MPWWQVLLIISGNATFNADIPAVYVTRKSTTVTQANMSAELQLFSSCNLANICYLEPLLLTWFNLYPIMD